MLARGCVTAVILSSCARAAGDTSDFAPVASGTPSGLSRRLEVDNTVAVAPSPGDSASVGASTVGCAYALRDPRTGTRFILAEVMQVETTLTGGASGTISRAEANYLAADGTYTLPADRFLRVACGSHEVLGLARSLQRKR